MSVKSFLTMVAAATMLSSCGDEKHLVGADGKLTRDFTKAELVNYDVVGLLKEARQRYFDPKSANGEAERHENLRADVSLFVQKMYYGGGDLRDKMERAVSHTIIGPQEEFDLSVQKIEGDLRRVIGSAGESANISASRTR